MNVLFFYVIHILPSPPPHNYNMQLSVLKPNNANPDLPMHLNKSDNIILYHLRYGSHAGKTSAYVCE